MLIYIMIKLTPQVPIVIPFLVLLISVYLVIAPIVDKPQVPIFIYLHSTVCCQIELNIVGTCAH